LTPDDFILQDSEEDEVLPYGESQKTSSGRLIFKKKPIDEKILDVRKRICLYELAAGITLVSFSE
jgi:hypothetical protein